MTTIEYCQVVPHRPPIALKPPFIQTPGPRQAAFAVMAPNIFRKLTKKSQGKEKATVSTNGRSGTHQRLTHLYLKTNTQNEQQLGSPQLQSVSNPLSTAASNADGHQAADAQAISKRKQAKTALKKVVNKATIKALFGRRAPSNDASPDGNAVTSDTDSYGDLLPSDFGSSLSSSLSSTKAFDFIGKAQPQTATTTHNITTHPLDLSLPRTRAVSGSFFAGHHVRELERDTLRKSSAFTRQARQSSAFTFASDRYEESPASSKTSTSNNQVNESQHSYQHIDAGSDRRSAKLSPPRVDQHLHHASPTLASPATDDASPEEDSQEDSDDEVILVTKGPEIRKDGGSSGIPPPIKLPSTLDSTSNKSPGFATSKTDAAPKTWQKLSADADEGIKVDLAALAAQRAAKPSRFAAYFANKEHADADSKADENHVRLVSEEPQKDRQTAGEDEVFQKNVRGRKPTPLGLDHILTSNDSERAAMSGDDTLPDLGRLAELTAEEDATSSVEDVVEPLRQQQKRAFALLASSELREYNHKPNYGHHAATRSMHEKLTSRDAKLIAGKRPGTPYAYGKTEKKLLARDPSAPFDPDESMAVNAPASPQLHDLPHDGLPEQPHDGEARAAILNKPLPADPPQPRDLQSELEEAGVDDFGGFDGFVQRMGKGKAPLSYRGSNEEMESQQPGPAQVQDDVDKIGEQAVQKHTPSRLRCSRSAETLYTDARSDVSFSEIRQRIAEDIARELQYEGRFESLRPTFTDHRHESAGTGPATNPREIIPENLHQITTPPRPSVGPRNADGSWETEDEDYRQRRARFVQLDRPWTARPRSARRDQFAELYTEISQFDPQKPSPTHTPTINDSSSSEEGPITEHRLTGASIPIRKTDETVIYSPTLNLEWNHEIKAWLDSLENDVERSKRLQLLFGQRHEYGLSTKEVWPDDAVHQAEIDGGHWDDNDTGSNDDEEDPARKHWHRAFTMAQMEGDFEVFEREHEPEIRAFIHHHKISNMYHIFPQWVKHPTPRRPWKEAQLAAAKDRWEDQLRPTTPPVLVDLNANERGIRISANGGVYQERRVPNRFRDELLQLTAAGHEVKLPRGFFEQEMQLQEHLQTHGRTDAPAEEETRHAEQVAPGVTMYGPPLPRTMLAERVAVRDTLVPSGNVIAELEALRNGQRQEQEHRRLLAHGDRVTPSNLPDGIPTRYGHRSLESYVEGSSSAYGIAYEHEDASEHADTAGYEEESWLGARPAAPPGLEQQQGAYGPDFYSRMLSGEFDDETDRGEGDANGAGEHDLPRPQPLPIGAGRPLPQRPQQKNEIAGPEVRRPIARPADGDDSPYPAEFLRMQQAAQPMATGRPLPPQPQQALPIHRPLPQTRQNIRNDSPYPQKFFQQVAAPQPQRMHRHIPFPTQQRPAEQPLASGQTKTYHAQSTQITQTTVASQQQAEGSPYIVPRSGVGHVQVFNSHPIFASPMAATNVSAISQQASHDEPTTAGTDETDSLAVYEDEDAGNESDLSSAGTDEAETVIYRSPHASPRPLGEQILDPEGEGFEDLIGSFADGEYDDRYHQS